MTVANIDAEIAKFIEETPAAEIDLADTALDTSSDEPAAADDSVADSPPATAATETEPAKEEPAAAAPGVDLSAVTAAIKAKDAAAFVKALGSEAESLLGAKAHKALRLQIKEADGRIEKATKRETHATELAQGLASKYGDPIAARKAAEDGDVDAFITLVEKWAGRPWNDVMRWTTAGMAGRKERLDAREREDKAGQQMAAAKREQAQAEVKAWADAGIKRLAPELHSDEVVALVVEEIRQGFSKGITTPAKALPLVKAKLEKQYKMLAKVFDGGRGGKPKPKAAPAPAARAVNAEGGKTRPMTIDESIADFLREEGIR